MAKDFAKAFYKSKEWLKCRKGYIASVLGLCEHCNQQDKIVQGKIVHHKILLEPSNINNPDIVLNWEHLEYLCQACHNATHSNSTLLPEGFIFDDRGQLIPAKSLNTPPCSTLDSN